MSTANGGGNGQAPTQSATSAGGNDPASTAALANNTSTPSAGQNGQAPTATLTPSNAADIARMTQELAEARRDAAKYRADLQKATDAQLTAEQKRERDFAELQTRHQELTLANQRLQAQTVGYKLATSLGISDIGAALALVQAEHAGELAFDETTGAPTNLDKLLQAVLKEHPLLSATTADGGGIQTSAPISAAPPARPASSGGATNPGAGGVAPGAAGGSGATITRASYLAMSIQERIARSKEIDAILTRYGGRLPD